jgi:ABC-type Fe3+-hydroxamate transport system substrate-binding protein
MVTKNLMLALMFGGLLFTMGCHSTYDIVLRNQTKITSIGKPKYDRANECYRFKDAQGLVHSVPAVSVSSISAE